MFVVINALVEVIDVIVVILHLVHMVMICTAVFQWMTFVKFKV